MNGTVAPPSSSVTAASTCCSRTPSSCAIFWLMFATQKSLWNRSKQPKCRRGDVLMDQVRLIHQASKWGKSPRREWGCDCKDFPQVLRGDQAEWLSAFTSLIAHQSF